MSLFVFILALLAMLGVALVLGTGLYSLFRGGEFNLKWSNKLMRMRVMLQALAILLLLIFVIVAQSGR